MPPKKAEAEEETVGICHKKSLIVGSGFLSLFHGLCSFLMIWMGVLLALDEEVYIGMGGTIATCGKLCAVAASANFFAMFCGRYGTRSHNKFCLLIYVVAQFVFAF
mmetsp:Transcript_11778/g.18772  ORF Transcript_11778/g.18772 Transcript_11778/m.18772 type:complete len:106 (-) Transcript_11778:1517-1834(-)